MIFGSESFAPAGLLGKRANRAACKSENMGTPKNQVNVTREPSQRGLLGDITNMVQASRPLGKVPKAFSFLQPKMQPARSTAILQTRVHDEPFSEVFEDDAQDPQRASEYASDVFSRLVESESLFQPKPDYMEKQTDINGKMRAILLDWMVEVHLKYKLCPETLFLTVNIIDRYLSVRPIKRNKLQLLGVVAMFIAAKYEEIDPPKVHDFSYITDHAYSRTEILSMECSVLMALEYQIAAPTVVHVLDRLQRVNGCDAMQRSFVRYVLELSLLDIRNLRHSPSVLVSAALLMSNEYFGREDLWPAAMAHHSRCSESSLQSCAADQRAWLETAKTASMQAMRKKYQLEVNHAVADMNPFHRRL